MIPYPIFKDRSDAGKQLGKRLIKLKSRHPIVLALPRGGVVTGFEAAKILNAELGVLVARKLGTPKDPEYGIGAIAEGGIMVLNNPEVELLGITKDELKDIISNESAEMERRIAMFRGSRRFPQVKGRPVILVDDGLATGMTAKAAVASARLNEPGKIIFAAPVCAKDTAIRLRPLVDELVCLYEPENFYAVGLWYQYFSQLTDREVVEILESAHQKINPGAKI